mmetsp:Transcript_16479/g.32209  ORF Transcript_16479/g.32209 Transcript_16479/m.32209 type:complete len:163 (-) Transcript_16479:178-666(-)
MGVSSSVNENAEVPDQRLKYCCHMEGETPVEIRIAYQQPVGRPPSPRHHTYRDQPPATPQHPGLQMAPQALQPSLNAEKPLMPRGAERLRLPPVGGVRAQPPVSMSDASTDGLDADSFTAPPDSEHSCEVGIAPCHLQVGAFAAPALEVEDDYFPEIVRIPR